MIVGKPQGLLSVGHEQWVLACERKSYELISAADSSMYVLLCLKRFTIIQSKAILNRNSIPVQSIVLLRFGYNIKSRWPIDITNIRTLRFTIDIDFKV